MNMSEAALIRTVQSYYDAVDSMDGEEMHRFALRLMSATIGWPLGNAEIVAALAAS